jgi:hypothetical protein
MKIAHTEKYINKGTVISTDENGLEQYRRQRAKLIEMSAAASKINKVEEELETLKNDISDIKELLLKVLEKNK